MILLGVKATLCNTGSPHLTSKEVKSRAAEELLHATQSSGDKHFILYLPNICISTAVTLARLSKG